MRAVKASTELSLTRRKKPLSPCLPCTPLLSLLDDTWITKNEIPQTGGPPDMPSGPVASKHEELQGYTEQTRKPPGVSLEG